MFSGTFNFRAHKIVVEGLQLLIAGIALTPIEQDILDVIVVPEIVIQPFALEGTSQLFPLGVFHVMVTVSAFLSLGFYFINELVCSLVDEFVGLVALRLAQRP